jgi:outer membrane protein assembly factor BamB
MQQRIARAGGLVLGIGLLLIGQPSQAVITRLTPLHEILEKESFIVLAKVETLAPDKPAVVLKVDEELKGKTPFARLPINLTGDSEGKKEKHPAQLLKRLAPELPVIVFTSLDRSGKRYIAFGYTNGTWFQMIGHVDPTDKTAVRWAFTHCEPYLRRTFKGTTAELKQVIRDGLDKKKPPPEPDPKEKPGLGPELKPGEKTGYGGSRGPVLAVIPTFALVGPLALLAALFPAVFGGLMLVLKRWMVLLSVASLNSTIFFLHAWFAGDLKGFWWGTAQGLWTVMTAVTLAGAAWSWVRYRAAKPEDRLAALEPRRSERFILLLVSLAGLLVVGLCSWQGVLLEAPWKESLVIWTVAWVGAVYLVCFGARPKLPAPTEGIMLWTMVFACAGLGATMAPRTRQAGVTVVWTFEPKERGTIVSSPLVTKDRVYVAAAHGAGLTQVFGILYCLDRQTGDLIWSFDNDGDMKQVSISSPCLADGRLYIGEGFHQDSDCKLYCLDAATGKKLWEKETKSHVESSPRVAGGRVFFGAGEDGVFCLDATTGEERWHFENVHVDTKPALVGGRVYAGSGYGDSYEAFCLDAETGKPVWRTRVALPVWGSPAVVDNEVYIGIGNGDFLKSADRAAGALLCLGADTGAIRWQYDVSDAVLMQPAVDEKNGLVYFAARDRHGYCLDRQGQLKWKQNLGSPVVTAPALHGSTLCVAASGGKVYGLAADTGEILWSFDVAGHAQKTPQLFSSPVVVDGRLYFGAGLHHVIGDTAALYCLEVSSATGS